MGRLRRAGIAVAVLLVPVAARAADPPQLYVTVKDRLMCRTQVDLRDGLRAIDAKNKTQLDALDGIEGWHLDEEARRAACHIVKNNVSDPVGPEFMAPPARATAVPQT